MQCIVFMYKFRLIGEQVFCIWEKGKFWKSEIDTPQRCIVQVHLDSTYQPSLRQHLRIEVIQFSQELQEKNIAIVKSMRYMVNWAIPHFDIF